MRLKELLCVMWKMQHLQFEYPAHMKENVIFWHFFSFLVILCVGYFFLSEFRSLALFPIFSWNYHCLFDKKKRAYKDSYRIKTYELIGTLNVSLLIGALIVVFALNR